jgi:hypothetical protein
MIMLCIKKANDLHLASYNNKCQPMAAKIDNAAVQDGCLLYHHVILFD